MQFPESLTQSIEPIELDTESRTQALRMESQAQRAATELRHRIAVLIALVALTPVLLLVVDLPSRVFSRVVLGSALTISLSTDSILLLIMPVLTVAGVDWILRDHPEVRSGEVPYLFPFWVAPGLAAATIASLLIRVQNWPLWIGVLIVGIIILTVLVIAEYIALSPHARGYGLARLAVSSISYVIAFSLLTLIYSARERTIISSTYCVLVAGFLALDLLAPHLIGLRLSGIFALVIGLLVAEANWALNYWNISDWSGGVMLLAIFYVATGLAQQHFQDKLTREVLIEFAVITSVALVVVWQLADIR